LKLTPPAALLRPARRGDEPFLRRLYADLRAPEFAALGLEPSRLKLLLAMQYDAQDRSYRQEHPHASFEVVMLAGEPIGRLYVDRDGQTIHVIDITLLPEHRRRGIGTDLLGALMEEGRRSGRAVTLDVLRTNPALDLYRRLGFQQVRADEVYVDLEYRPGVS
jgi:ribosomal protein S18 acetylase RimI-like enzyme